MQKYKFIFLLILITFTSCKNNNQKDKVISKEVLKKIDYRDVDWGFGDKNNDIILNIKLQKDFTLTKQNFYDRFLAHMKKVNLRKMFKDEIEYEKNFKMFQFRYLYLMIQNELLYQEGLRNEDIKVENIDVERIYSSQKNKILMKTNLAFDQYLKSINSTQKEYLENIRKDQFKRKVEDVHILGFVNRPTPAEVLKFYNSNINDKKYQDQFMEVYLLEFPKNENEVKIESLIANIKTLKSFQKLISQSSIHESKRLNGKLKDIPKIMSRKNRKKESPIIQLIQKNLIDIETRKATLLSHDNRKLVVWIEKEILRKKPIDQRFQEHLARIMYDHEKEVVRRKFVRKIASSTSFKIKINGKLQSVDLPYFIKSSFKLIEKKNPFKVKPNQEINK